MDEQPDSQLLREYAEQRNEAAFRELVRRYTDLVYSAALRQVNSPEAARDVAQEVFTDLAAKAKVLLGKSAGDASIAGWLYRSTRFLALNHRRDERRRSERERQVMQEINPTSEAEPEWERVGPALDEVMDQLADEDREAVLLRYFKNDSLRSVGVALGVSEDAAQKRVSRAVERLRESFTKRGVKIGAGGLVAIISSNAVQSAPVGLALTLSTAAALTGTTIATTATVTATKAIAMTIFQKTLVTAIITMLAGAGIYETRKLSQSRQQVRDLQQAQATFVGQIQQLERERDDATNRLAAIQIDSERSNQNTAELLKLRNEVTQLRNRSGQQFTFRNTEWITNGHAVYGIDTTGFKAAMRVKLRKMNARLNLSDDQSQSIEEILTNQYGSDREVRINALLSPQQQTAYRQLREEEVASTVRAEVNARLQEMQAELTGLTAEQEDKILAVLYPPALNEALTDLNEPPSDPLTSWQRTFARAEKLNKMQFDAVANILSPAQLEAFRVLLEEDRQRFTHTFELLKLDLPQQSQLTH